ncbi:hypothetical protein SLS62_000333 [Diatrype stigma]|uniref:Uncharacterized protein n=1 Tax=Diatrype stigma TaxID=117547 RepID=A0AAN9YY07_9PEZI
MPCSDVAAVLAEDPLGNVQIATIFAQDTRKFAALVRIYTNGNEALATELSAQLPQGQGMGVDRRKLKRNSKRENDQGLRIDFDKGPQHTLAFMTNQPQMRVGRTLPDQLGCEMDPKTDIKVNPTFYSKTVLSLESLPRVSAAQA